MCYAILGGIRLLSKYREPSVAYTSAVKCGLHQLLPVFTFWASSRVDYEAV